MPDNYDTPPKAVVLLSGGLDSTTVLAIADSLGYCCYCLSFSYGQRQAVELERAREVAHTYRCKKHLILQLDLDKIGGSALTGDIEVPKGRATEEMQKAIPVTYVPGRNIIFLSHAVAWAEVVGANHIFIGVNVQDYSGYPDCRPEFLDAFTAMVNLGTRAGTEKGQPFTVHAPLMKLTKKEIILKGISLGVDYFKTHSCYDPDKSGLACGACDACLLRLKGFEQAGLRDPLEYSGQDCGPEGTTE
ncbi:MAG: 7-cyano-7-deazaguanine synthase QueC [Proteobacteria bacterium]|nr:7-cyano-7-deazaguanine synthase QueC [Pseudomonadota bacterium]MBU1708961.1 7-cyano-7-deazaguanine synthase QueC [Pseudomonadota bacterium]